MIVYTYNSIFRVLLFIHTYNVIKIFYDLRNKLTELYGIYDQDLDKKKGNISKVIPRFFLLENLKTEELVKLLNEGKQLHDSYKWIYNGTIIELNVMSMLPNIDYTIDWYITIKYTAPNYFDIINEAMKINKKNEEGL